MSTRGGALSTAAMPALSSGGGALPVGPLAAGGGRLPGKALELPMTGGGGCGTGGCARAQAAMARRLATGDVLPARRVPRRRWVRSN